MDPAAVGLSIDTPIGCVLPLAYFSANLLVGLDADAWTEVWENLENELMTAVTTDRALVLSGCATFATI